MAEKEPRERNILGIDPGTSITGYGILRCLGNKMTLMTYGIIDLRKLGVDHPLKLKRIFERTLSLIDEFIPDELAIEAPFHGKNVQSMLKLGRALGVATVVLRLQNVYGPGQSLRNPYTGIISIFSNQMRQNLPVNIYEDGCESRDFVYVDDVAHVCERALTMTAAPVVMNVGSGCATRMIDLARILRDAWGSTSAITVTGDYRLGDIRHNWSDNKLLAKYAPDWEPTPLKAGLERFVDWAKAEAEFADSSQIAANELTARDLGYQRTAAPQ